jgi:hypothetical protein
VTVKSGSVNGLRNESGQYGYRAGEAWINLVKGFLLANGSQSTITVQTGNTGPSTYYGQSGDDAYVQMGFGSQLAATKDLIVQAGHGGDAGLGQSAGTVTVCPRPPLCELGPNLTRRLAGDRSGRQLVSRYRLWRRRLGRRQAAHRGRQWRQQLYGRYRK